MAWMPMKSYQGYTGAPRRQQTVEELLSGQAIQSEPLGEIMPDLSGAASGARSKRSTADLLTQRAMGRNATGIVDGLSQLGEAWLANRAIKKADAAESEYGDIVQALQKRAMAGDEESIAMLLSPEAAIGRRDALNRQGVEDARYEDERDYGRGRDQIGDQRWQMGWDEDQRRRGEDVDWRTSRAGRQDFESDRSHNAAEAARRQAGQPRNIWQSAGNGVIFNQATGATMDTAGQGGGFGQNFDPRMVGNSPFFQSQGITPDLFQNVPYTGGGDGFQTIQFGGPGLNQQGFLDDTRPDDQGARGPAEGGTPAAPRRPGEYGNYRSRQAGSGDAKRIESIRTETADNINSLDVLLNEVESLMAGGVPTGALSGPRYELGRWNQGLKGATGIDLSQAPVVGGLVPDTEQTAAMGAMTAINTQLGLLRTAQTKGAISNYEMELFLQSVPGMSNTPEGNQLILQNMRKLQARQVEYGQAADVWDQMFGGLSVPNPETGQSFDQAWAEYTRNNPWMELPQGPTQGQPTKGAGDASSGNERPIQIQDAAGYASVPSGALYIAPDGKTRRKP